MTVTHLLVLLVFACIAILLALGFLLLFWKIPLHSSCGHFIILYVVGPGEERGKEGKVYKDKSNAQEKQEKCVHDRVKTG